MAKITREFRLSALRRGIIVRSKTKTPAAAHLAQAATLEMANLGFLADPTELSTMSLDALNTMLTDARAVMGADRAMTPIYPGFPEQVENLDTLQLLFEQILHYWTAGAFLPNYPDVAREGLPLEDMVRRARKATVLDAAATARELIRELTTSPIALSTDERELLENAIELQHPTLAQVTKIAKASRNGENLQTFLKAVAAVSSYTPAELVDAVADECDNTDQLLRAVLTVASAPAAPEHQANYDLAVDTLADRHARAVRMGKLSRPARRSVVAAIGDLSKGFHADRLVARRNLWRNVMRAVHPYDFKLTGEQKRAVDIVHSNVEYRTLNSLVEEAMETADVLTAVKLLSENQPGNLLRRAVAILRLVKNAREAKALAEGVRTVGGRSALTTLISAYNGVLSANDDHARVTRVAGLTNTMLDRSAVKKVSESHLKVVVDAFKDAIVANLATKDAPAGPVAVTSSQAVPLVRRDAATADRVLDRGQELTVIGDGDVLRMFGHWNNNQRSSGYMDIGVVLLDENFATVGVSTWNTWSEARDWSTYSGDCHVHPGGSAAEFIDVKLPAVRKSYSKAKYAAMTVQSWSGWPMNEVDFIAGAMLRSDGKKGQVFDARTVETAFKPTTTSTQSVPFVVELDTMKLVWLDSSNGSTAAGVSASNDDTVGSIVYDELQRPRLTMGELATLWAEAHGAEVVDKPVDRSQLLDLLG